MKKFSIIIGICISQLAYSKECPTIVMNKIGSGEFNIKVNKDQYHLRLRSDPTDGGWTANNRYIVFFGLHHRASPQNPQISFLTAFEISKKFKKPLWTKIFGSGIKSAYFIENGKVYVSEMAEYEVDIDKKKIKELSEIPAEQSCPIEFR